MIRTLLYNTSSRELKELEPQQLREGTPDDGELEAKHAALREQDFDGAAHRGRPQCGRDEFLWVDVTAPDESDYELLCERFELHPMVLEDIRAREGRPKLHSYGDYLYLIFFAMQWGRRSEEGEENDGPARSIEQFDLRIRDIDCLVGADYVVTIHRESLAPLDKLRERWQQRPELTQGGTGALLYEIMDGVLDDYFPLLDALDEHIDNFEEHLFADGASHSTRPLRPISREIFALRRHLIRIRRIAGPTRDVVNVLLRHDADTDGKNFAAYQDLYDHATRIVDQIDNFREILTGALDAYLAAESNRMNMVMKTLTACSIILLVPSLIAAIYGMNFAFMPELRIPHFYGLVLGIMLNIVLLLTAYFKRLKWL